MDWKILRGTGRPGPYRVPYNYFGEYYSADHIAVPNLDAWVTGKFSPSDDNTLFIGGDTGYVSVVDVEKALASKDDASAFRCSFRAAQGVVMDIVPVPGNPDELLTMSGSDIRVWTLGTPAVKSLLFFGHEKSVRAASFVPNDPNVFATGGRDGCIFMWDRRVAPMPASPNSPAYRRPVKGYKNCHQLKIQNPTTSSGGRRRSDRLGQSSLAPPNITSMTHLDEHTIISCSDSAKSGIRLWDTRRMSARESRPLAVLELPSSTGREAGVSSICLDRFKSSLFAVSTDNCIYEFNPNSGRTKPVRSYVGACVDGDFYIQMACSPISDHILCGSGDKRALIWDAQKFHSYADQPFTGPASTSSIGIRPSLSLGGHDKRVSTVGYSANARYMLSMDDDVVRIWKRKEVDTEERVPENGSFEMAQKMEQPMETEASSVLESFSITPGPRLFLSPTKAGMAPLQKRKEPFASPFKSRASMSLFNEKENIPPGKKPYTSEDASEVEEKQRREERKRRQEERRRNPFYFKFPTMHLPNLVYERHSQLKEGGGEGEVEKKTVEVEKRSSRKVLTLEGWARSSDGRLSKKESLPSIDENGPSCVASGAVAAVSTMTTPTASPRKLPLRQTSGPRNLRDYFKANRTADNQ